MFAEGVHGYGESTRAGRDPRRAGRSRCFGLGVAAIVFAWAHARRLGPPDRPTRDAAAAAVPTTSSDGEHARTHPRLRCRARTAAVRGRATSQTGAPGCPPTRNDATIETRRATMGLTDDEIVALWHPPANTDDVLALGRVVARVTDERTLQ